MDGSMKGVQVAACDLQVGEAVDTCRRKEHRHERFLGFLGRDEVAVEDKEKLCQENGGKRGQELEVVGDAHRGSVTSRLLQHHALMLLAGKDPVAKQVEPPAFGQAWSQLMSFVAPS